MATAVGRSVILAAMLASRALWSQEHALTGTVSDSTRTPIVGVAVSIGAVGHTVETDSAGRFSLGGLPPDTLLVRFEKVGYRVGRMRVLIREMDEPELALGTIQLKAAPSKAVTLKLMAHEDAGGRPIEGAALALNGRPTMYTGKDGSATQRGLQVFAGLNAAVVRRIGYQAVAFDLWIPERDNEVALEARLKPAPVTLGEVVVVGEEVRVLYPWTAAFLQRAKMGLGDILTEQRIKQIGSPDAMGLLRWLPKHSVWLTGSSVSGYRFQMLGEETSLSCHGPVFYVNGIPISSSSAVDQLEMTAPEDVLGVEVYSHAGEIPPEFNATGSSCGVIAFWIRR